MSTDIEQDLRGAMERFTRDVRVPPGLAVKAYRHQQKRRVTTRAVAAAGTVTAAAATAVAVAGATGAFGSAGPSPAQATYTAYVVSHVQHALAASRLANLVEADRTVFSPGSTLQPFPDALVGSAGGTGAGSQWSASYTLRWIYHGSAELSSFTASGQRVFDWVITPAGRTTAVIYIRGQEIVLGGGSGNGWPAFIRSQLACGAYTVAGRQMIDGIDTIKITGTSSSFTFWVNPVNYLPVRANLGSRQTDFRWLPASPVNLARLNVTVPAGFKQVPAPPPPAAHAP
jgi:hypothetical protein